MARFSLWQMVLLLWAVLCAGVSAALDSDLDCDIVYVALMGDGRCDEEYNTQACGFDGGDCCECTCWDKEFSCGATAYNCVDPDAICDMPGSIFRDLAENDGTHNPTSSPTPTPSRPAPVVDDNDAEMASSSSSSSSSSTGVIVGVSAAVVLVGVGFYFYRKRRTGGGGYDATSEYTAAGYSSNL